MTIYQRMEAAFELARVPLFLQEWRKTDEYPTIPELYAVYNVNRERTAQSADDAEIFRRYDISVWLYGKSDVSEAAEDIRMAMEAYGVEASHSRDGYARRDSGHLDIKTIDAVYVDFGDYGIKDEEDMSNA